MMKFGSGEKTPTATLSASLRRWSILLRGEFVLTQDLPSPYEGQFCGKIDREGSL